MSRSHPTGRQALAPPPSVFFTPPCPGRRQRLLVRSRRSSPALGLRHPSLRKPQREQDRSRLLHIRTPPGLERFVVLSAAGLVCVYSVLCAVRRIGVCGI